MMARFSKTGIMAIILAALWLANPSQSLAQDFKSPRIEKVKYAEDGDTLILESGKKLRLTGIAAPKRPPHSKMATDFLQRLSAGKEIRLQFGETTQDRHGRILAQAYLSDQTWLQAEMIKSGLARVYIFPDNRAPARQLLPFEQQARQDRKGLWADSFYAVRDPIAVKADRESFQLVEGTIMNVAEVKRNYYLNFGDNWHEDFTIQIPYEARRLFQEEKIKIRKLAGKRIRVRGWITDKNGPLIEASHPEIIEILN